jgi:L-methionine (R)-S-oxide reductase
MRKQYMELLGKIEKALKDQHNFDERLKLVVKFLKIHVEKYNWVGIYLKSGEELLLHNYIGKPTAHAKIPISEGICGAAVRERQTVIVDDVNEDSRYIACSLETRSEIVVPIYQGKQIIGEIDIDSDDDSAFDSEDKEMLERVAAMIGTNGKQ